MKFRYVFKRLVGTLYYLISIHKPNLNIIDFFSAFF